MERFVTVDTEIKLPVPLKRLVSMGSQSCQQRLTLVGNPTHLLLPEVAAHHRVEVLVDAIGEVLADHADHAAFPVLQVAFVDKIPLLHHPSL